MPIKNIKSIEEFIKNIKLNILEMALAAKQNSSHFGGSLSTVEIIACIFYNYISQNDIKDYSSINRHRFILSKGHSCLAYYSALCELGFFNKNDLTSFEGDGSFLLGHPVINRKKGIEFSTGSLGMGLGLGIGQAISMKIRNINKKVFVLIGDGECNEGSVWEAAMAAPNFNLENLYVIIDKNNFQQTGSNKQIMSVDNLRSKWESFNWYSREVDGHNIDELLDIFNECNNIKKPKAIIANTIKGKGFSFSENNNDWHHKIMTKETYDNAIKELKLDEN